MKFLKFFFNPRLSLFCLFLEGKSSLVHLASNIPFQKLFIHTYFDVLCHIKTYALNIFKVFQLVLKGFQFFLDFLLKTTITDKYNSIFTKPFGNTFLLDVDIRVMNLS